MPKFHILVLCLKTKMVMKQLYELAISKIPIQNSISALETRKNKKTSTLVFSETDSDFLDNLIFQKT
jgi:hypothetical protein